MAFLQALGHLLGNAAHTVNNDIVKPVQRDVLHPIAQAAPPPVANGLVHLWQLANPNSGANQGAALQQQANNAYHFTPAFNQLISSAHPSLNSQSFDQNGNLAAHIQALGESFGTQQMNPKLVNEIQLAKLKGVGTREMQDALVHEGLHQQWAQASSQQKDQFFQAYNKLMASNSQDAQNLKGYLTGRLSGYRQAPKTTGPMRLDAGGVPIGNDAYNNIGNLSPEIQNEVHSFIPQYFAGINTANPLTHYYSQYFKPSGAQLPAQNTLQNLGNITPGIYPGVNNKPDWLESQQQGQ